MQITDGVVSLPVGGTLGSSTVVSFKSDSLKVQSDGAVSRQEHEVTTGHIAPAVKGQKTVMHSTRIVI